MSEPTANTSSRLSNPVLLSLLLVVVTLAVYWPVRTCGFLCLDDPTYFSANTHVLSGLTGANIGWAFTTGAADNWHPLTWLSLMLDAELFGKGPAGPHIVNLLFHVANVVLIFFLLRLMTSATWRSLIVAGLFALHPLHVESVAWIAERKDVLSLFFELLALLAYVHWVRARSARLYIVSLVFFALALMSKPMAVTLPFLLLLLDWWPLGRLTGGGRSPIKQLVWEKAPYFVLTLLMCVVTFVVQHRGGAVVTLTKFSITARIDNAFVSYARYLQKAFWPFDLAMPYPHPGFWPLGWLIFSVVLFAALSFVVIRFARRKPFLFTGWFWFVGTLVPVLGLVQVGVQSMADRYAYLPVVGIFIILAWGGAEFFARWRVPKVVAGSLVVLIFALCIARTRSQLSFWQNDGTLFGHALAVTKNNYVASINLGFWFSQNGQPEVALEHYHAALAMSPNDPTALFNVGNALNRMGRWDEAIADYHQALKFAPDQYDILSNLGFALVGKKDYAAAAANFEGALRLKPDSASAHNNLATILFIQNRFEEAVKHFQSALETTPDDPQIWSNLGDTYLRLNQAKTAVTCYQQALQLNPDNQRARAQLQSLGAQ